MLRRCVARAKPLLPPISASRGLASTSVHAARSSARPVGHTHRSTLAEEEKQAKKDVAELVARLARAKKQEESQRAEAQLPELDESTLDSIYEALNTPEPATDEDRRLARRQKKLSLAGGRASHLDRIEERLQNLNARLTSAGAAQVIGGQPANDQPDAVARLIPLLLQGYQDMAKEEPVEEEKTEEALVDGVRFAETFSSLAETRMLEDRGAQHQLLERIGALLASVEKRWGKQSSRDGREALPIGIATRQEWEALAVAFASHDDYNGLEKVVDLMQRAGHKPHTRLFNNVLDVYANRGDVEACQSIVASLSTHHGLSPDDHSFHCLAKAYLRKGRTSDALALITQLEDDEPASMATYTMVAQHLSQQKSSAIWSLFNRMRLVAHPVPDAPLYATMIRACAMGVPQDSDTLWKPGSSILMAPSSVSTTSTSRKANTDAERALDLFREMTTRYQVRPTAEVYNAVILACARRKDMLDEAFRLLRAMVEFENERLRAGAENEPDTPSYAPDRQTYNALLQGCARVGDVVRARWILAEMLRHSSAILASKMEEKAGEEEREWTAYEVETIQSRRPDATTMANIFYSYASYDAPVKISHVKIKEDEPVGGALADEHEGSSSEPVAASAKEENTASFSFEAPKTSVDVVREVKGLMARIVADQKDKTSDGLLSSIHPDARLIHSYLSALARHSGKHQLVALTNEVLFGSETQPSLFDDLNVKMTGYTFALGLELSAKAPHRVTADILVSRLWNLWAQHEEAFIATSSSALARTPAERAAVGIDDDTVSRCWAAMIRNLTKSRRLDEAMLLLRTFVDRHPPRPTPTVGPFNRPASLFSRSVASPQTARVAVGPVLTFEQLKPLHHALVEAEGRESRKKDLGLLSWAGRAYDATVRPRMPAVFSNRIKMQPPAAAPPRQRHAARAR